MNQSLLRILIVDDHGVVRMGYRRLLESDPRMRVVGECENGEQAIEEYARLLPQVVIMDIALPGSSGIETARRILARDGTARILGVSVHEEPVFVERAIAAGMLGYVPKSRAADVLNHAVLQVSRGTPFIDEGLAQVLAYRRARGQGSALDALTLREFEVFCMIASGLNIDQAAGRLALSYKTVAGYCTRVRTKLGIGSVGEWTRLAIRHGVIEP